MSSEQDDEARRNKLAVDLRGKLVDVVTEWMSREAARGASRREIVYAISVSMAEAATALVALHAQTEEELERYINGLEFLLHGMGKAVKIERRGQLTSQKESNDEDRSAWEAGN